MKLEIYTKEQDELLSFLVENQKNDKSLILLGYIGTGKTYMCKKFCSLLGEDALYTSEVEIENSFSSDKHLFNHSQWVKTLVIDEVGLFEAPRWLKDAFMQVLYKRYENGLSTYFISNLDIESFKIFIGERMWDRLRGQKTRVLNFKEDSLRGREVEALRMVSLGFEQTSKSVGYANPL